MLINTTSDELLGADCTKSRNAIAGWSRFCKCHAAGNTSKAKRSIGENSTCLENFLRKRIVEFARSLGHSAGMVTVLHGSLTREAEFLDMFRGVQ
jgi:hypothetical protein